MSLKDLINRANASPTYVSIMEHSGWGCIITTFAYWFVRRWHPHVPIDVALWLVPLVLLAAWKEFYYDMHYESPPQTVGDSAIDFVGYILGLLISVVLVALVRQFG